MKKGKLLLLFLFIIIFVILTKYNGIARNFFLDFINPIKVAYLNFTDISSSYLQQQKKIIKLEKENAKLNKLLIEQSAYIQQLSKVYKVIPSLAKKPYKSIYIVDTISYVKLNKLNEVMLTTPKNIKFKDNKLYALMQNDFAAGIAKSNDNKLHGYLLTNKKCNFSVTIGKNEISGIAQGDGKQGMVIKFIPRWSEIKIGDIVKSSGLDGIFYPNIPVGEITDIKVLDRYKIANIKIYANLKKPSMFFLIYNPSPYLTTDYMPKTAFPNSVYPFIPLKDKEQNTTKATQTKESSLEPEEIDEKEYLKIINSSLIWDNNSTFDKFKK